MTRHREILSKGWPECECPAIVQQAQCLATSNGYTTMVAGTIVAIKG